MSFPRRLPLVAGLLTVLAALLASLAPAHSADAADGQDGSPSVPDCVRFYPSWRYTTVDNACTEQVTLTVVYTDGQEVPCRTLLPGDLATFPGYGPQLNHVTGLRACPPETSPK
ncbi:alpha-amylase [Streptomyces sp. NPDC004082]|uniref:alpha-amylase n=1 Tax=unclassified Streptomyces TaxID=2593676 RepID=UPI0033A4EC34